MTTLRVRLHAAGILALVLALVAALARPSAAQAPKTLTVTSLEDRGPGTLRDALEIANAVGGAVIRVAVAGTITLRSALPPCAPERRPWTAAPRRAS